MALQRRLDLRQGHQAAALSQAAHHHAVAVDDQDRGQGAAAGLVEDRLQHLGRRLGLGIGGQARRRGRPLGQQRRAAQVDAGRLGPVVAGVVAGVRIGRGQVAHRARPQVGGGRRQGRALRGQLGLGLAHQGVLVGAQEDGPDSRHGGGEQQHGQQDGPQAQGRPPGPDPGPRRFDHPATPAPETPWQAPSR
jgi:hypothetical protein